MGKFCTASQNLDEYIVKCQQADGADEDWSTSAKKVVEEKCGLLARSCDAVLQFNKLHDEIFTIEKGRSESLKY